MVAFTAGAVLTAANLNTAFNALTFRAVTGTSDTFVLADNGGAVSYSNASPITATVPPFSSVAYANGTVIQLLNLGAGVVTVTAGAGVTLNGLSVTIAQNAGGTLIKTATNTWYFLPNGASSKILQVVSTTKTDTFSTASTSFTDLTGVSAAITPTSATNKVLVFVDSNYSEASSNSGVFRLMRDSTAIAVGDAAGSRPRAFTTTRINDASATIAVNMNFLDSPATTAATTYKVQMLVQGGTGYVNRTSIDSDVAYLGRTISTITLMEVSA